MKTFAKVIIVMALVFFWILIVAWYFFAFDLQWGVTWQSVTLGLPLLAAIVLIPLCVVYFLKRRKWRWGFYGVGGGFVVLVYTGLLLVFFSYLIVGEPKNNPKVTPETEENRILKLVLSEFGGNGIGYLVVDPEISTRYIGKNAEEHEGTKKYIQGHFMNYEYEGDYFGIMTITGNISIGIKDEKVSALIDRFLEINQSSANLTLKSSPKDGYYIDYDGKFSRYYKSGFDEGWIRTRLCRPATFSADISLPVYDPDTGLILIYFGSQGAPLSGSGDIYLFEYKNGNLKCLGSVMVWIS
jgi:hypothetical protein